MGEVIGNFKVQRDGLPTFDKEKYEREREGKRDS